MTLIQIMSQEIAKVNLKISLKDDTIKFNAGDQKNLFYERLGSGKPFPKTCYI